MFDFGQAILDQINESASKSVTVGDLYFTNASVWQGYLHQQLIELWKDGKVFVSRVERALSGYIPETEASWAAIRKTNYYGYDIRWGVYQISDIPLELLTVTNIATLNVGFQIQCMAIAPNKEDFIIGGKAEVISLGSLSRVAITKQFSVSSRVWSLDFSPIDGQDFASGHNDGTLNLWNIYSGKKRFIGSADDRVTGLQYSPDGNSLISAHQLRNSSNYPVRMWLLNSLDSSSSKLGHHRQNVYCIGFLHDGQSIVSAGSEKILKQFSLTEERVLFSSKALTGTISCLVVHPKAHLVITGGWSKKINVFDLDEKKELAAVEAHAARVTSLAISPSGHLLASGCIDSQIAIWQFPQMTLLKRFTAHDGWIRSLKFADDETLLSGGTDGLCKIWNLNYQGRVPATSDEFLDVIRRESEDSDD